VLSRVRSVVRSSTSAPNVTQTPPYWVVDGHLCVITEHVIPEGVPTVSLPRAPSARGQDWSPLRLSDAAWQDREVGEWLGDTPLHLAASALMSREFLGHMAISVGVVTGAPALDDRLVPLGIRGLTAMSFPALGFLTLR